MLGPFSHVRIHDAGDSLLPQLIASKIQFAKYGISYFADYMVSGVDASAQSLVPFSNINSTIFILFPGWFAYGILMLGQRLVATIFTYLLLKEILKLNRSASIVGALLFSLFNFSMYSFTLYHALGLPAIPLILWFIEKFISSKEKNVQKVVLFGLVIGFCNYFAYFSPYVLPFIFVWFLFIRDFKDKKTLIYLILFSLSSTLPMLPNILSLFQNSQISQRSLFNLESPTFYPQGIFMTSIYMLLSFGKSYFLSIAMVIVLYLYLRKSNKLQKKLTIVLISLILAIFTIKLLQPLMSQLPLFLQSFAFDRFEFLIPFMIAILAATFLNQLKKNKKLIFSLALICILVASVKIKIETFANYSPYKSLYLHPDLFSLAKLVDNRIWRVATLTGGGAIPAYALANGLYSVDSYLTLYPRTYHTYWSGVIEKLLQKDKSRSEDFMDWGNRVYLYGPNDFDYQTKIKFSDYYDLERLSFSSVRYIISTKPIDESRLRLLNSPYRDEVEFWNSAKLSEKLTFFIKGKYSGRPYYIYENKAALPKFYLRQFDQISNEQVNLLHYTPDKIDLKIEEGDKKNLIITNNYYPWWQIFINGKEAIYKKYSETFISLDLESGNNFVTIIYKPQNKIW